MYFCSYVLRLLPLFLMNGLYESVVSRLLGVYAPGEARAVARVLMEDGFGVTLTDIYAGKVRDFSPHELERLNSMTERLEKGEPVQYVVGRALFGELTFEVSPAVLVPRPETWELVQWITGDLCGSSEFTAAGARVVDIGTGSGCIAVSIAKSVAGARVTAVDISGEALGVARRNAVLNEAEVEFAECDILAPEWDVQGSFDVIVSNPPYVCRSEIGEMHCNVLGYEPHGALFVDDSAPLVFYEAIVRFASERLAAGGAVYVEINRRFGVETADVFARHGFGNVELRRDSENNPRMIKAKRM